MAYAYVLIFQVLFNYWMCRRFVFREIMHLRWNYRLFSFVAGILGFRLLDWTVYQIWIYKMDVYYLFAQVLNVCLFLILKFIFTNRLFAQHRPSCDESGLSQTGTK